MAGRPEDEQGRAVHINVRNVPPPPRRGSEPRMEPHRVELQQAAVAPVGSAVPDVVC